MKTIYGVIFCALFISCTTNPLDQKFNRENVHEDLLAVSNSGEVSEENLELLSSYIRYITVVSDTIKAGTTNISLLEQARFLDKHKDITFQDLLDFALYSKFQRDSVEQVRVNALAEFRSYFNIELLSLKCHTFDFMSDKLINFEIKISNTTERQMSKWEFQLRVHDPDCDPNSNFDKDCNLYASIVLSEKDYDPLSPKQMITINKETQRSSSDGCVDINHQRTV